MNWDERRPLNVALSDRKKNGRAAKMLSVLRDGQPHTRAEIFERVGCFFLTNNAASELRQELEDQGYGVAQWTARECGQIVHVYQLVIVEGRPSLGDGSASESDELAQPGAAVAPPPTAPEISTSVEGHLLLDSTKAGGSLPCSPAHPDGSAGRHPSFAKQLEIWSAA